ncbi:MAG: alanine--tRNA ligase [Candidatus Moranbacteria bacterium CG10_big_fil_rev_8_21_14_0_10_35_21]|nr:MAG: alanine--tRNA ligase [Candidatus Moranbacteria bacterium CG10_big_fil_rev_8_21_14_0_10_35_21]PJA88738.1 MAG: alanine--tRNA ligase [Candidatus Moranbacteria bacterium CG_4_9_14_3_um_filter_36_9]
MIANELRQKYLEFFKEKGHTIIPSASLVPENDPSVLFTTAGMHPLVPYLTGESHPGGKRVVNIQKCVRTSDIDEVGDATHHTFFEMAGNWSFGDYFKEEAIEMSYEFLIDKKWLGLDKNRLAISVFAGDEDAPFDEEAFNIWKSLGISEKRIAKLPKKNNWWGMEIGPCGPDTEMFYWVGKESEVPESFEDDPESLGWVEIWNDVFMEYDKTAEGKYEPLKQKNVDTGMGLIRVLTAVNGLDDNYETELFAPVISKIEELSNKKYKFSKGDLGFEVMPDCWVEVMRSMRIIADHIQAATFMIADGVEPLNVGRGYVLRRLIRRAVRYGKQIGIQENFTKKISEVVVEIYKDTYSDLENTKIFEELDKEENNFKETLENGLKEFEKMENVSGTDAFNLYQTFGFPLEMTEELALEKGIKINKQEFEEEFKKHKNLSRTASAGQFKGGLQSQDENTTRLHTATHLLLAALRQTLSPEIYQKGSNINAERLRFDFNYPQKLTEEQLKTIENLVNEKIQEKIPLEMQEMSKEEALKTAKISFDPSKYGDTVKVYKIGDPSAGSGQDFSVELCGGPHVKNISELGKFKIIKEEASSAGVRRIKAILE